MAHANGEEPTKPSLDRQELSELHSSRSSIRLEQIAELRARGIGEHVDLPQLVVCGDQSAGKSSVLEGITGLPFPRQDGVCTKFATEIILQHSMDEQVITATIIPANQRSDVSKADLRQYSRRLHSFDELPSTIEDVGCLMGIRGFKQIREGPAFGEDVLRIEVSGRTGLHLTVVDLPGIISVANEEQTDEDVETVQSLVDSYVSNRRTIILAVVQASNDIANQAIIQKSRKFDKKGQRTVGIITKPDLINIGTEKRIALLAKNQDTTKLKLGFFLVKNPTPIELAEGIRADQRQRNEERYFQSSPWKEQALNRERVGIKHLRTYLQTLLDQHIERELPKVREEIRKMMIVVEQDLSALGEERPDPAHLRMFLSRMAMRFNSLVASALNGTYHETDAAFFGDEDNRSPSRRLRARIHKLNATFAEYMRLNGQKRKVCSRRNSEDSSEIDEEPQDRPEEAIEEGLEEDDLEEDLQEGPMLVTEGELKAWVKKVYIESRGKELPGNYNHILLSKLFHAQSSRWPRIAQEHVDLVHREISQFVQSALSHVIKDDRVRTEVLDTALTALNTQIQGARWELEKLCLDEKLQPITYNHYYTDNIQRDRQEVLKNMLRKAMNETTTHDWNGKLHVSNNNFDAVKFLSSMQNRISVDMDVQACSEALSGLHAYYKVAQKTFVDNVCRQVIERHMLQNLAETFGPETVAAYGDEDLQRIAAELPEDIAKRKQLQELHANLGESLRSLQK